MTIPDIPTNWRELLKLLTERPVERQRVADELGVTPYTVTRWISGESEPRMRYFKRLPDIFPEHRALFSELIQAEFSLALSLSLSPPIHHLKPEVPSEFLVRVFAAYATMVGPFRAWSLRSLTLRRAVEHLDADHLGIELTVVLCTPPSPGQCVRSIVAQMSLGTAPWEVTMRRRIEFLGLESLSGWTVSRGEPGVVQDLEHSQSLLPLRPYQHMRSAVAWPLQREGKLAGCLRIVSTQRDYFNSTRLSFVEVYANTLSLSFRDNEFYPLPSISLQDVPVLSEQKLQEYMIQFRDYVRQLRQEWKEGLSEADAEKLALQYLEAEVLHLNDEEAQE